MTTGVFLQSREKTLCSGCGACAQVCAKHAITMTEDSEGFLYPNLDKTKCVDCGLCLKICPYVNNKENKTNEQFPKCKIVVPHRKDSTLKSATIGLTTRVAEKIISKGGVVYGVILDETDWHARHVRCNSLDQLERTRNSKYIQSELGNTYRNVLNDLRENIEVLFIGTPCQVAGLKAFLRKQYDNLLTIDLICHGIFSHIILGEEVKYWEDKHKGQLSNYRFRSKRKYPWIYGGIVNFDISKNGGKKHYEYNAASSPAYRSYAYSGDGFSHTLRPSCYSCNFRSENRYADITIGDAWGIILNIYKHLDTISNRKYGVSLCICNTPKGLVNLHDVLYDYSETPITKQEAYSQPALLKCNRTIPGTREQIYSRLGKKRLDLIIEDILSCNFRKEFMRFKVQHLKKSLKALIYGFKKTNTI